MTILPQNTNKNKSVKTIKKNPNKETNKNLTYENMRLYISLQDNAKELLKEFDKQLKASKIQANPYRSVLAWFKKKFEGYLCKKTSKLSSSTKKINIFSLHLKINNI